MAFAVSARADFVREVSQGATFIDYAGVPVYLDSILSFHERITASCVYQYIEGRDPITLHGRRADSEFWPDASLEVATKGKGRWRVIGTSHALPEPRTTIIDSRHPRVLLNIDMGAFRAAIGTCRWGRIVLENGDAAIFELDDLLPTKASRDSGGNYKETLQHDFDVSSLGGAAYLQSITCLGDHYTGDFVYFLAPATLKGNRTQDGDFWPQATFEVGSSKRDWSTIGKSRHDGAPTEVKISDTRRANVLRVPLDKFKASVGKARYGKIVFSNGTYGVFELQSVE